MSEVCFCQALGILGVIASFAEAFCTGVAALLTIPGIYLAWLSASQAKHAAEATLEATRADLVGRLLDDYDSKEMDDALRQLEKLKNRKRGQIEADFRQLRSADSQEYRELDRARRKVSHYYQRVCAFHTLGMLDKAHVEQVASRDQVYEFIHVNMPLEYVQNRDYDRSCFRTLARLLAINYKPFPEHHPSTD
jgi:hypothetical protein